MLNSRLVCSVKAPSGKAEASVVPLLPAVGVRRIGGRIGSDRLCVGGSGKQRGCTGSASQQGKGVGSEMTSHNTFGVNLIFTRKITKKRRWGLSSNRTRDTSGQTS